MYNFADVAKGFAKLPQFAGGLQRGLQSCCNLQKVCKGVCKVAAICRRSAKGFARLFATCGDVAKGFVRLLQFVRSLQRGLQGE